uniref:NYN domain-containing protein n=1 Tax=Heterorhabditis bacteriophora TaxID=37862 RepID=A0A1I7XQK9_HETBA
MPFGGPYFGDFKYCRLCLHTFDISGVLEPPRVAVIDAAIEQGLHIFMAYFKSPWLPPNGEFCLLWDHSRNYSTRTINFVKRFHILIRASYPTGTLSLDEILKFYATELTMAKTLVISIGNGNLKDRYIRPNEEDCQKNMLDTMQNFHQHIVQTALAGVLLSTRELKQQYLDTGYELATQCNNIYILTVSSCLCAFTSWAF